jgi:hypothetical protein
MVGILGSAGWLDALRWASQACAHSTTVTVSDASLLVEEFHFAGRKAADS